ncbi:MOLPALP family lipoprotein [Spiroplasma alleghenense]|uniref:MOLPALP family lipoprotein n=1 Tax=Spiroplasma alleghenense TaxID=216931 RepID=A0A345Z364_9MOLU|nr:MOLPALP family lipoprotein [Spiroplasma alleghenense]AXK51043.1 MOLPALP family lipoprotein [Spiroplasma alleghenense]
MKKILSVLASVSLITSTVGTTVACFGKTSDSSPQINESQNLDEATLAAAQPFILADIKGYNANYIADHFVSQTRMNDSLYLFDKNTPELKAGKTIGDFWQGKMNLKANFEDSLAKTNLVTNKNSDIAHNNQAILTSQIVFEQIEQSNLLSIIDGFKDLIGGFITPEIKGQALKIFNKENLKAVTEALDFSKFEGVTYQTAISFSINMIANALSMALDSENDLVETNPSGDSIKDEKAVASGVDLLKAVFLKVSKKEEMNFQDIRVICQLLKAMIIINNYIEMFDQFDNFETNNSEKLWSDTKSNEEVIKDILKQKFSSVNLKFSLSRFAFNIDKYLVPKDKNKDVFQLQKLLSIIFLNNDGYKIVMKEFLRPYIPESFFDISLGFVVAVITEIISQKPIKKSLELILVFLSEEMKAKFKALLEDEDFLQKTLNSLYYGNGLELINNIVPTGLKGNLETILSNFKIADFFGFSDINKSINPDIENLGKDKIEIKKFYDLVKSLDQSDNPVLNGKTLIEAALENPKEMLSILGFDKENLSFDENSPLKFLGDILENKDLLKSIINSLNLVNKKYEALDLELDARIKKDLLRENWKIESTKTFHDLNYNIVGKKSIIKFKDESFVVEVKVSDDYEKNMNFKLNLNSIYKGESIYYYNEKRK